MKAIRVENLGEHYRLVLGEAQTPALGRGELLVKVAACGVNRADLLQARGLYPPPPGASETLGMEISGEIARAGPDSNHKVGEKICALIPGGGYAGYALAAEDCVLPVPAGVSLIDASALPEAFFTVWTNFMDSALLAPGESVLIHGGSSGIGTAAIQLLAARGHNVFTTAGSAKKCAACEKLGASCAINYREKDFVAVIEQATAGSGVDVILDMVGGDYIQRNMRAAGTQGRIVNIAYQNGMTATVNFAPMLKKHLSLHATTLRGRSNAKKGAIRDALLREVWPLIAAGRVKPVVDSKFPLAEAQKAHDRMAQSGHIGKILLLS